MRTPSAASIKQNRKTCYNGYPREGTKLREIYDFFAAHKGEVVDFVLPKTSGGNPFNLDMLTNYYGLDIRCLRRPGRSGVPSKWIFAGEWINGKYVSYFEPGDQNGRDYQRLQVDQDADEG